MSPNDIISASIDSQDRVFCDPNCREDPEVYLDLRDLCAYDSDGLKKAKADPVQVQRELSCPV